ncbi:hypothetical protein WJX84_006776 [Apatococcus fuscideae]|uniref:Guanylate cyclase domain-containing protein n=1 Tax=Apatococcus fuscideae TaxID=2026836 RepID=A0AAW1SZM5_9CHLO
MTKGGQILMDAATSNEIARAREELLAEFSVKASVQMAPVTPAASKWQMQGTQRKLQTMHNVINLEVSGASAVPLVTNIPVAGATDDLLLNSQSQDISSWPLTAQKDMGRPPPGQGADTLMMHMGLHILNGLPGSTQLYQLIVPGLEERARFFPAIRTRGQLNAGYLDAPAAALAPLTGAHGKFWLPPVTMVFCAIEHMDVLKGFHPRETNGLLFTYRACIRDTLAAKHGYECQEADGDFMLVFETSVNALNFCLAAQDALLQVHWEPEILQLDHCGPVLDMNDRILFAGPRVRMGVYEGVPTRIHPHTISGRADYFGMLVNRAARYCHAAAYGGQITAPLELVQSVLSVWTGMPAPPMDTESMAQTPLELFASPVLRSSLLPWKLVGKSSGPTDSTEVPSARGTDASELQGNDTKVAVAMRRSTSNLISRSDASAIFGFRTSDRPEPQEVHVRHVAGMHFKGVQGEQTVMDVSTWAMHRRTFPKHAPNPKGKFVRAGTGLQYVLRHHAHPCDHPLIHKPILESTSRASSTTLLGRSPSLLRQSYSDQEEHDAIT